MNAELGLGVFFIQKFYCFFLSQEYNNDIGLTGVIRSNMLIIFLLFIIPPSWLFL
jgi:hypothetical protein